MLTFDALRKREFSRLDRLGHVYADYTGAALYGDSQVRAHQALLADGIFGNPHADSPASRRSTAMIDEVRETVLRFFGVDSSTHEVCFTANTTAAIKLVAESYPFDRDTTFALTVDNHNSVNGIREFARVKGARIEYGLPATSGPGLFAFPAQSNFSGELYPLTLVDEAHGRGLDVLLDVAAYVPSHPLDLRRCRAEFAVLSFYKLFGYPTGIGALIARREALAKLRRPWFAGGTVMYASVAADTHRLRPGHEAFEDGTPDFLNIAALPAGFALLEEVGMERIESHVNRLTNMFLDEIEPFATLYGRTAFNLNDLPYWEVESLARTENISLRGGCFCNPGAAEIAFGLEKANMAACFDRLADDFTVERFSECAKTNVGALRVSFGAASNESDVRRVARWLEGVAFRGSRVAAAH
jgi:selenocysteine lyase/cysteine desulfurase